MEYYLPSERPKRRIFTIFETHGSVRITAFTLENHPMIDLKLAENLPNNHFALLQYFGFD
jgi:hypothetical protein